MKEITINFPREDGFSYEKIRYPGGESQIRLAPWLTGQIPLGPVNLVARITKQEDIVDLCLLADTLAYANADITLYLPYLPYARADRRFVLGDTYGLKVFASILNTLPLVRVVTLDEHSDVAKTLLAAPFTNVHPDVFVKQAVGEFLTKHPSPVLNVLFPDVGAGRRYAGMLPKYFGNNISMTRVNLDFCTKTRDVVTGKLSGFVVPEVTPYDPVLIVDDICDGGGTFKGIAAALRGGGFEGPLGLYITHGIFSNEENLSAFDNIFVTNSFRETYDTVLPLSVFRVMPVLLKGVA